MRSPQPFTVIQNGKPLFRPRLFHRTGPRARRGRDRGRDPSVGPVGNSPKLVTFRRSPTPRTAFRDGLRLS